MEFKVTILGSNSALPTMLRHTTSQVVQYNQDLFLIDCGEGTQLQLRRYNISFAKINHIFISHLHGDHYYGIFGLLTSFALMGRKDDLHIYSHSHLKEIINVNFKFSGEPDYKIVYHDLNNLKETPLLNLKNVSVSSFPLKHRLASCGFIFREKQKGLLNINPQMIRMYELKREDIVKIKAGHDYIDEDGKLVKNERLTLKQDPLRSYAFCSDTAYFEKILPTINEVNLLYHEATFIEKDKARAKTTKHSTAMEAARIAKLANVKQLIIGHFSSRYTNPKILEKEAKTIFENTIAVNDGDVFEI